MNWEKCNLPDILLQQIAGYVALSNQELVWLAEYSELKQFSKHQMVLEQGAVSDSIYFVVMGINHYGARFGFAAIR